jgi:predicted nucleic acid-binding protein
VNLVLDASVAAKYLIPEVDSENAKALLNQWREGRISLLAPEILPAEVANVLWKKVRRGEVLSEEAEALYLDFQQVQVPLTPINELVEAALRLAMRHGHSVYDGLYVALAQMTGRKLITADEKLFNTIIGEFRQVYLLRHWA